MANTTLGRLRCVGTELVATAVALGAGLALWVDLRAHTMGSSAGAGLVALCEWALLACVVWAWVSTTAVVVEALLHAVGDEACRHLPLRRRRLTLTARSRAGLPGVPQPWRRLVLLTCGVALGVATAVPAQAAPGVAQPGSTVRVVAPTGSPEVLRGLPMPERPTAPAAARDTPREAPREIGREVVVRAGDTLWSLARADLPPAERSSAAAVGAHWRAVHQLNRAVLGPDPDFIVPGQRLTLPPSPSPSPSY